MIDPSAHTHRAEQQSSDDGTARGAHGVLAVAAGEHYANAARDGVGSQATDGAAVQGVDFELHGSGRLIDGLIVSRGGGAPPPLNLRRWAGQRLPHHDAPRQTAPPIRWRGDPKGR